MRHRSAYRANRQEIAAKHTLINCSVPATDSELLAYHGAYYIYCVVRHVVMGNTFAFGAKSDCFPESCAARLFYTGGMMLIEAASAWLYLLEQHIYVGMGLPFSA